MEKKGSKRLEKCVEQPVVQIKEDCLDVEKAGKLFGIGKWGMYKKVAKNEVPYHKMGRKIYFLKSELLLKIKES